MPPPAAVDFRDVTRTYEGREVFRALTATVPSSGVTFVVGKSGAGKSVLCRLAVGLERPDSGEVFLFGQPVHRLNERDALALRKKAPYLVQGPALLDWLSLEQNVALADPKRDLDRARRALARVGLAEFAGQRPVELGPGVRKRAAIARALALEPDYLLFDEPTTGLDHGSARQVSQVLRALRDEGLGAMVVSHDYPMLQRLADRVLLVEGGRARMFDSVEAFLRSDAPEVRELLAPLEAELGRHG